MFEPLSLALIGGAAAAAQGIIGNRADHAFCKYTREVGERLVGKRGLPANHDALRSIRAAQLKALVYVVDLYASEPDADWEGFDPPHATMFVDRARDWIEAQEAGLKKLKISDAIAAQLMAALDVTLSEADNFDDSARQGAIQRELEGSVIAELSAALTDVELPPKFLADFHAADGEGPGWYAAFSIHVLDLIKLEAKFRDAFVVTRLASLSEYARSSCEVLSRVEAALREIRAIVGPLSENMEMLSARLSAGTPTVSPAVESAESGEGGFERREALLRRVVACYEALGFHIARKSQIAGHDVELVGTKHVSGLRLLTTIIEVGEHGSGPIGARELVPFLSKAQLLLSGGHATAATFVSDRGFDAGAKAAVADSAALRLLTLEEIESELFNPAEALIRVVADYERSPIFSEYVPVAGAAAKRTTKDVSEYILDWLNKEQRLLVVAGDFGTGKTTVMERVRYALARRALLSGRGRFPILLPLRMLRHHADLWDFISASLRDRHYVMPSRGVFEEKLRRGELVVLLDGFDEIHAGATYSDRSKYLQRLSPLLVSGSPCVISTRPTYFESFDSMVMSFQSRTAGMRGFERVNADLLDAGKLAMAMNIQAPETLSKRELSNVIQIESFDHEKVLTYLNNYSEDLLATTGKSPKEIQAALGKIYDLEDLTSRPLLLRMIVQTVLSNKVDITDEKTPVGPATLYEAYTQICAERDIQTRGEQNLTRDERLAACRAIAMAMLDKGTLELGAKDVSQVIEGLDLASIGKAPRGKRAEALEGAVTDIRVCSFLTFGQDGALRFAHKSYFEFFVAQTLVSMKAPRETAFTKFAGLPLNREMFYFLGSFARDQEPFRARVAAALRGARGADSAAVKELLSRILFASGVGLQKNPLGAIRLSNVELRRAEVDDAFMAGVELEGVNIREVAGRNWEISRSEFKGCEFADCKFEKPSFDLKLENSGMTNVDIRAGALSIGGYWRASNLNCADTEVTLKGAGRIHKARFSGGSVQLDSQFELHVNSSAYFDSALVYGGDASWCQSGAAFHFADCHLGGVFIDERDLHAQVGAEKPPPRTLRNCRGVIITNFPDAVGKEMKAQLAASFPRLLIAEEEYIRPSGEGPSLSQAERTRARTILDALREEMMARKLEKAFSGQTPLSQIFLRYRGLG